MVKIDAKRELGIKASNDLYLQKEVSLNRKIPLNGYLSINIGEITELKHSLDNIKHLLSLYNDPDSRESLRDRTLQDANEDYPSRRTEGIDRERALLKIYREGLNLGVMVSVFEQTPELKERFNSYHTQVVFQTLYPNFDDEHEYRIKMDTMIFEHLKYRAAVFEVRHYFINHSSDLLDLGKHDAPESDTNSEFQVENRDYLTLGYAKVPLVNLITKSCGVDQNVAILDSFNQKLGYLRLKMSLNYQSKKKLVMYKEPAEKPIEGQYFLGFSFVELISKNNRYLQYSKSSDQIKHLLFKFKWQDHNHQVRYVPELATIKDLPLSITVYFINKMCLIDFDINDTTFEKAATPIEIQLWTKSENKHEFLKDKDELIGSVFVDIQSLIGQRRNPRLRNESLNTLNSYDGYYTILHNETNNLMPDRLGLTTMLIKKEYPSHKEDLENLFYAFNNHLRKEVLEEYDLNLKGTIESADMDKLCAKYFTNQTDLGLAKTYINCCEIKQVHGSDESLFRNLSGSVIYYSPLMNLLPPFFKYARRIDRPQIIEFMYKRLSSVDEYANGFVGNMFRNILETEVQMKEKLVDDLVANLKPNPLDYNLTTHTMKLKTDYLLLIRKLYGYLDHLKILEPEEKQERLLEKVRESQLPTYKLPEERKCALKVSIEAANNIKNPNPENSPPNTYVCFKNPFETGEVELRTPVVYRTTFPQWNYEYDIKGISITHICNFLLKNELEFEVYHKKMPNSEKFVNQESILVGRVYIDASNLVKDPKLMSISGYYHIFKNPQEKDFDSYDEIKKVTQGQIKLSLSIDKPLVSEFQLQNTELRQHEAIMQHMIDTNQVVKIEEDKHNEESLLDRAIRQARQLRNKHKIKETASTNEAIRKISKSPERRSKQSEDFENRDKHIISTSIQELRAKNIRSLKDLDDLTSRLRSTLNKKDDLDDSVNIDDLARATNQDFNTGLEDSKLNE